MAQLVERLVRNEEASGSNPLISTKRNLNRTTLWRLGFFFYAKTASRLVFLQARRSAVLNNFVNLLD